MAGETVEGGSLRNGDRVTAEAEVVPATPKRLPRCNQCAHMRGKLYEAESLLKAKTLPLNNRARKHLDAINGRIEWLEQRKSAGGVGHKLEREESALRYAVNVIIAFGSVPEKVAEVFSGK